MGRRCAATLAVFLTLCGLAEGAGQIRCAVVTARDAGLSSSSLVSLLEARLSRTHAIELLERAAIDKVLNEQQLSLAGFLDRDTLIQAGRLLRADVFVLLSREGPEGNVMTRPLPPNRDQAEATGGQVVRARAVETTHGLRLWDYFEPLDGGDLEAVTARIASRLEAVAPKLNLPAGHLIPVGIIDIHRFEMGERYTLLERALPMLLSSRLSRERQIIVLEREDLKLLLDEKRLAQSEDAPFWGSAVLIDGTLRLRDGMLEMQMGLRRSGGAQRMSLTRPVDPNSPATAIDQVVIEIAAQLQDTPSTTQWHPGLEAEEFYRQGQLLYKNQRYRDAVAPLETAYALQPANVFYTGALFLNEWYARFDRSTRTYRETGVSFYSDLELAGIVTHLVRQIRDGFNTGRLGKQDVLYTWGEPLGLDYKSISYFGSAASVSTESIRAVTRESRTTWIQTVHAAIEGGSDPTKPIELAWTSSDAPEEVIGNLKTAFADMSRLQADQMTQDPPAPLYAFWRTWFLSTYRNWRVQLLFPESASAPGLEKTQFRGSEASFRQLWLQYLLDAAESPYPVARFISCLALCDLFSREEYRDTTQSDFYRQKAVDIAMHGLLDRASVSDWMKRSVIAELKLKPYITPAEFEAVLESLVAVEDLEGIVLWDPGVPPGRYSATGPSAQGRDWVQRYRRLLDKISRLLQPQEHKPSVGRALASIRDFQTRWRGVSEPREIPSDGHRWPVTMLLRRGPQSPRAPVSRDGLGVKRQQDTLWLACSYRALARGTREGERIEDLSVRLIGLDLERRELTALWQAPFRRQGSALAEARVSGLAVNSQAGYVSVPGLGLVEFPGSLIRGQDLLHSPKVHGQENGLPSVLITSITGEQRDRLWVAYGGKGQESGLGVYEPNTGHWETVLCSTLKGPPPFHAGRSYKITALMPCSDRTLYFQVVDPGEYWRDHDERNCDGLWKLNLETRLATYLGPFWQGDMPSWLDTGISKDTWWLIRPSCLAAFEVKSETMRFLLGHPSYLMELRSRKKIPLCPFEYAPFIPDASMREMSFAREGFDLWSAAVHEDQIWARLGMSQIAVLFKGRPYDQARIMDNTLLDGEPVVWFVSTPYGLIGIGDCTVGLIETSGLQETANEQVLNP